MDRKEYLEICQRCAVLPEDVGKIKKNIPNDCKVVFGGILYYPVEYILWFDRRGKPMHTAVLHDLKVNSLVHCDLEKVERYNKQEEKENGN